MKFEFRFPDIGEGIAEGTLMKWLVKEGEEVEEGQSLAEVETDKVTTEIPSPKTGRVLELKAEEGDVINVGDVFITIDTSGEGKTEEVVKDELDEKEELVEEETAGVVGEVIASSEEIPPSTEGQVVPSQEKPKKAKVLATPVARKLAKDLGVDITKIKGTGPNGR
ncbi:MAG: 2-oxo acid dehydrogenase subunit E2, partial [Tissierellia bacterium]|nr:2-oxo acid dehydrogenase subunit E2 [Tissierellia bacterium]